MTEIRNWIIIEAKFLEKNVATNLFILSTKRRYVTRAFLITYFTTYIEPITT